VVETEYDVFCIVKTFKYPFFVVVVDYGVLALTIEVSAVVGRVQRLGTQYQLRRELLVFVEQSWSEAQRDEHFLAEEVSPGAGSEVSAAHIFRTRHRTVEEVGCVGVSFLLCEVKDDDVGTFSLEKSETQLVRQLYEVVVSIDKLDIFAPCEVYSGVACLAESAVGLSQVENIVAEVLDFVYRTDIRTVVDKDYLAFSCRKGKRENAFKTFFQHIDILVVIGDDKTYNRCRSVL